MKNFNYITAYKCGHTAPAPAHVVTDLQAKNFSRWAKGQGLCPACLGDRKMDQAYVHARQHLYAELEGSYKQVRWALNIRQAKLTEIDLAQRTLVAYDREPERRERLLRAHDRLARNRKAAIWIEARELTMDELVESCLGASA